MTSARLPLVALSTCATPSMPASSSWRLQVAGGVGELGEDQHLLAGEFLRLQQPDQLLELVVVLRLELPGLVEEVHDLVEVEERLGDHLGDVVLLAVESLDGVEQLLRDDVLVLGLVVVLAPELELTLARVAEDLGVLGLPALEPLLLGLGLAVHFDERKQLLQQPVAGQLERRDRALEALEEVRADQADDLLLAVLLEGIDALVRPLVPGQRVVHRQREERVLAREGVLEHVEQPAVGLADRVLGDLRRLALGERRRPCRSRGSGSRVRRRGCAGRRAAGRSRPSPGSPAPRPRAPATSATSCPTALRSAFSMLLKCARRLLTPSVRAK